MTNTSNNADELTELTDILYGLVQEALEQYDDGYAVDLEKRYVEVAAGILESRDNALQAQAKAILSAAPEKRPLVPYGSFEFDRDKDNQNSHYNRAIDDYTTKIKEITGVSDECSKS